MEGGEQELGDEEHGIDIQKLTASELREARPDLVAELAGSDDEVAKMKNSQIASQREAIQSLEQRVQYLDEAVKAGDREKSEMHERIARFEAGERKTATAERLEEALSAVELPKPVEKRIRSRFAEAETADGIAEAIRAEVDYLRELRASGTVKGLGDADVDDNDAIVSSEGMESIFEGLGFSKESAKIASEGRQ